MKRTSTQITQSIDFKSFFIRQEIWISYIFGQLMGPDGVLNCSVPQKTRRVCQWWHFYQVKSSSTLSDTFSCLSWFFFLARPSNTARKCWRCLKRFGSDKSYMLAKHCQKKENYYEKFVAIKSYTTVMMANLLSRYNNLSTKPLSLANCAPFIPLRQRFAKAIISCRNLSLTVLLMVSKKNKGKTFNH